MALTLKDIDVGSKFIDNDTIYNGSPIEWIVAAKDVDGTGIVTLVKNEPITGKYYDAAEPTNPNARIQEKGNADYQNSNILQWLNSDAEAGAWYSPKTETDTPPSYQAEAGFLNGFGEDFSQRLFEVSKMGISKKVHLLGWNEIGVANKESRTDFYTRLTDDGATYGTFATRLSPTYYHLLRTNVQVNYEGTVGNFLYTSGDLSAHVQSCDANRTNVLIPVAIYADGDIPAIYSNSRYYAKWNKAPTVTIDSNLGQHKTAFDFAFTVNDEESDVVSVNAYVDNTTGTAFYSNNNVTLNTPITTAIPTATYDALNYGNHKIIIVASDGQKTTTVESSFEKFDIAPSITVDSSFGQKKYTFGFVFRVVDADDTSSNVTVELEGTQLYSDTVALDTDITVNIPANVFEALSIGQHTITITASDGIKTGTATPTFQRIEISAPVITCEDVGNVLNGFTTYYQVYDEDGGTVDVNIKLDGATISSATDVSQQADIPITISDAQVTGLSYGAHSILITATDSDNYTSTRTINFNKKSTPYVAIVNPTIGDVTAPFDIVVNYNSPDGDEVTVKAVIDGTIEV